ncbi:P4 family phage/plasmid primase-like protein [Methanohalophilus levihalophilus]|uniref:DNA primase family protein n=1 Tax=Methanohalophilus levihalophilus TaxID=1431282 RepID=UPI001AE9988F|nr:phage/plasmid primase, P4 family [Methanohalophilus levihalophilus]MBP2030794.1 P4 family phage/plasmid primase-like protein [Methanohalophilus levihalophilus]
MKKISENKNVSAPSHINVNNNMYTKIYNNIDEKNNTVNEPEINSMVVNTGFKNFRIEIEYNDSNYLIFAIYNEHVSEPFILSEDELIGYNDERNSRFTRYLKQIAEGKIKPKELKEITNKFFKGLGTEENKKILEGLKQIHIKKQKQELTQLEHALFIDFCKRYELSKVDGEKIQQYSTDLARMGNSQVYISQFLYGNFDITYDAAKEIAEEALFFKHAEMVSCEPEMFFTRHGLDPKSLANHIMSFYKFLSIGTLGKKDIYVYQDGIYVNQGRKVIRNAIIDILDRRTSEKAKREVIHHIEDVTAIEREQLNNNKYVINLNNGLYDTVSGQFMEHDPDVYSTIRIPVNYNPKAKCPQIEKFLSEVVSPEDAQNIIEFAGYCLIPDTDALHKALFLFGKGKNGKSVATFLIERMIGEENISAVPLQKFDREKFAVAGLFGKLVNICADLPSKKLADDSVFKMLISGDTICAEEKFKEQFKFKNTARLVFNANKMPRPAGDVEDVYAFYRRLELIEFPNNFEGREDPDLIKKLTTDDELSGFLNLCLEGLLNVLKNKRLTHQKTTEEVERMYKANMDSVNAFFDDCINYGSDVEGAIPKQTFYQFYCKWCKKNSTIPVTEKALSLKMKKTKYIRDTQQTLAGKRVRVWKNIKFVSYDEDSKEPSHKLNIHFENEVKKPKAHSNSDKGYCHAFMNGTEG